MLHYMSILTTDSSFNSPHVSQHLPPVLSPSPTLTPTEPAEGLTQVAIPDVVDRLIVPIGRGKRRGRSRGKGRGRGGGEGVEAHIEAEAERAERPKRKRTKPSCGT